MDRILRKELAGNPHPSGSTEAHIYKTLCYTRSIERYGRRTDWVTRWVLIPALVVYAVATVALIVAQLRLGRAREELLEVQREQLQWQREHPR